MGMQLKLVDLRLSLHLNIAQAGLKIGTNASHRLAIDNASKALGLDAPMDYVSSTPLPSQMRKPLSDEEKVKGLYRRALARIALKEFDEAVKDLLSALELKKEDNAIKSQLATAKKGAEDAKKKQKAAYAKMFG